MSVIDREIAVGANMRPITKPSASAAKISKAITTAKLIGLSPWAKATTLARKGYLSGQCQVERLPAGFLSSVT